MIDVAHLYAAIGAGESLAEATSPESSERPTVPIAKQRARLLAILAHLDVADAEDIAHDALLSAWRFRRVENTPLTETAMRLAKCLDRRREFRAERATMLVTDRPRDVENVEPSLRTAILDAFSELPSMLRDTLWSFICGGSDYRDVAEDLGVHESAVRARVFNARRRLRSFLNARGFEVAS